MADLLVPIGLPATQMRPVGRSISTMGGGVKVTGWDGNPAAGRCVLLLGTDYLGAWSLLGVTTVDGDGNYQLAVDGGANDRYVVVVIGDPIHQEYTRALGDLQGAD